MTSLLDHPMVSGKYLFPQDRCLKHPTVFNVNGVSLACYHKVVERNDLTLVYFHGNGEAVADYVPWMTRVFDEMEVNQLFIEYRGYGGSTGQAQLVAMLADGQAVMQAAGLIPEQTVVFGRSIGSLYAIELAARQPNIAGLIIESGIADPHERFMTYADLESAGISDDELRLEVTKHFDRKLKLSTYANPLLILHTEHDGLIDISHAERILEWSGSHRKRLVRFPSGNHNSIFQSNKNQYISNVAAFIERLKPE